MEELLVDGQKHAVRVGRDFAERVVKAVASKVLQLVAATSAERPRRVMLGVCGPPGAGKSTLAALVQRELEQVGGLDQVAVLGMDAYHLPNAQLDQAGLRSIKGHPCTIDAAALAADLSKLRSGDMLDLPLYDRNVHEPREAAVRVTDKARVVVVEGIHLCEVDEPGWSDVCGAFDMLVLLDQSDHALLERRLVDRKVRCGVSEEDARAHFARTDAPNIARIQKNMAAALARGQKPIIHVRLASQASGNFHVEARTVASSGRAAGEALLPARERTSRLLILGPNPALQKTLTFESRWERDNVNRASSLAISVGGKGQQFARALNRYIGFSKSAWLRATLFQFLGGPNGARVKALLESSGLAESSSGESGCVSQFTVNTPGVETRVCTTLVEEAAQTATEIVEPSESVPAQAVEEMVDAVFGELGQEDARAIALCGTMPPGAEDLYVRVARAAAKSGHVVWLDGYKGVDTALGAVSILKVNRAEALSLAECGAESRNPDVSQGALDVAAAASQLFRTIERLDTILVTDGPGRAFAFQRAGMPTYWEYHLPRLAAGELVNPIGAGDTVGAVTLANILAGLAAHLAFAKGLAAGTASCLENGGADFDLDKLGAFLSRIRMVAVQPDVPNPDGP